MKYPSKPLSRNRQSKKPKREMTIGKGIAPTSDMPRNSLYHARVKSHRVAPLTSEQLVEFQVHAALRGVIAHQ